MALLLTEEQWAAFKDVEDTADRTWWMRLGATQTQLVGGIWSVGQFQVVQHNTFLGKGVYGPERAEYHVIERNSFVMLATWSPSKVAAIQTARGVIQHLGAEAIAVLIARCAKKHREYIESFWRRDAEERAKVIKPKPVSKRRKAIFQKSGGRCHYCQTGLLIDQNWHVEHKFPRALGGSDDDTNLVAACIPCNYAKRDRTEEEFFELLAQRAIKKAAIPA